MIEAETVRRTPSGRFAPGQSGNPAGRPKGARSLTTRLAELLEEGEGDALIRDYLGHAHGGDKTALRFFAARLLEMPRGRAIRLDLPEGAEHDSAFFHAVAGRALADGQITPAEALEIGRYLATRQPVMKAHLVERRLAMSDAIDAAEEASVEEPPSPLVGEGRGRGRPAAARPGG